MLHKGVRRFGVLAGLALVMASGVLTGAAGAGEVASSAAVTGTVDALRVPLPTIRWDGADRYEVAVRASAATFPGGADTVYIANGLASADALTAGPVAGRSHGPILLVKKDGVPDSVVAELDRLDPSTIVVLGGTGSVSTAVETKVARYTQTVVRWAGADRYVVSANISRANFEPGVGTVFVANGLAAADALAAGPVAGMEGGPVLLVKQAWITPEVAAELDRLDPARVVILGGTGSVAPEVEARLHNFAPSVVRWAGVDRYAVAVNISRANFAPGVGTVFLANGLAYADALAAVPPAVAHGAPILLTRLDSIPPVVWDELERLDPASVVILGGLGSVSFKVEDELEYGPWPPVQTGVVSWVIDGDTVDVSGIGRVRLIGIDSPEVGECGYPEATAMMEGLVLGRTVTLSPGSREDTDSYGRLLRYVDVQGVDSGRALIGKGLAIARYDSLDGYGFHLREADYRALDAQSPDFTCTAPTPVPTPTPTPTPAPTTAPPPGPAPASSVNCSDFTFQREAQAWFDYYYPLYGDIAGLDGDDDLRACETLP